MAARGKNFRHRVGGRPLYAAFRKSTAVVRVQVAGKKNDIYLKFKVNLLRQISSWTRRLRWRFPGFTSRGGGLSIGIRPLAAAQPPCGPPLSSGRYLTSAPAAPGRESGGLTRWYVLRQILPRRELSRR